MGYFRELPNLFYPSFLKDRDSSLNYLEVKNLFRRVKLRDDLQNVFTIFNKYAIPEGSRPDTVAEELYGNDEFDWVVCLTAGIINVRNDWPLSDRDLYDYAEEKYGTELNSTRFYETKEIKDTNEKVVLKKGKVVYDDFEISYCDLNDPTNTNGYITKSGTDVRTGITNFDYEVRLNNKKRNIYVLKRRYLQTFLNDIRDIMTYQKSSQYINEKYIETENLNVTMP